MTDKFNSHIIDVDLKKKLSKQKQIRGWIMFDWANSAYNLVIVSTVFPIIFKAFVPDGSEFIGITFKSSDSLNLDSNCLRLSICDTKSKISFRDSVYFKFKSMMLRMKSLCGFKISLFFQVDLGVPAMKLSKYCFKVRDPETESIC